MAGVICNECGESHSSLMRYDEIRDECIKNLQKQRNAAGYRRAARLREQITQLKADLAEFGGHTAQCIINTDSRASWKCCKPICGYAEAVERWK